MAYLDVVEYLRFGLKEDTADDAVAAASAMVDAFCRRPSLFVTAYTERLGCRGRAVQLTYLPVAAADGAAGAVTEVRVRQRGRLREDASPFSSIAGVFGVSGEWAAIDAAGVGVSAGGVLSVRGSELSAPFDEIEVGYTAGFAVVPDAVKVACAQIVRNGESMPALNVRRQRMDAIQTEYFSGVLVDAEVRRLLQPFVAERVG